MSMRFLASLPPLALSLTTLASPARAQSVPPECRALVNAQQKLITTPHHGYSTETPVGGGAATETNEIISVGGRTYLLDKGTWRRSPLTPQMQLDQMNENIANAKEFTCERVGDDAVGGEPAVVYTSHTVAGNVAATARLWVSKRSGLPLRNEEDVDTGDGDKRHISIRYEFTNVRAPAGAR
jgi:hypothetical protein